MDSKFGPKQDKSPELRNFLRGPHKSTANKLQRQIDVLTPDILNNPDRTRK